MVVGAGWAGLSAAFHLSRRGYRVTVLEKTRKGGGRTYSFEDRQRGEQLDNGEHVLLGLCSHFRYLLREAGLESTVRFQPLLDVPVVSSSGRSSLGSKKLPGSLHLAGSVLRYGPLDPMERIKALLAGLAIQLNGPADSLDGISFAEWLKRHGQSRDAISLFWEAIGTGILNARANEVSASLAIKTFSLLLKQGWKGARLGLFVRPLSEITQEFQSFLKSQGVAFRFESPVNALDVGDSGVVTAMGPDSKASASAAILALPPDQLRRLVDNSALDSMLVLPDFDFSPILNVYLFYDRTVFERDITLLPDDFGAMVFNRTRLLSSSSIGRTTLVVSISAARELRNLPMADLSRMVEKKVRDRLRLPKAESCRSVWQPHATFLATPGSEHLRPDNETNISGLFLAGDWTRTGWPACLEGAVLSGQNAANATISASHGKRLSIPNET